MNIKTEKKLYMAPEMTIQEMSNSFSLLAGSTEGAPDVEEYGDELGFAIKDSDRKA